MEDFKNLLSVNQKKKKKDIQDVDSLIEERGK